MTFRSKNQREATVVNQRIKKAITPFMSTQSDTSKRDEEKNDFMNFFNWKETRNIDTNRLKAQVITIILHSSET